MLLEVVEAIVKRGVPGARVPSTEVPAYCLVHLHLVQLRRQDGPARELPEGTLHALAATVVAAVHAMADPCDEGPSIREGTPRLHGRIRGCALNVRTKRLLLHVRVVAPKPADDL